VTVVEVVGATGMVVADCSVVVVLLILSGSPQLANKAVPPMSPTPISNLKPNFMSVMETSVWNAFRRKFSRGRPA
jgi:hypothetical protein